MTNPIRAIIVGAGHRAMLYASYAQLHPDELQIVGVADPMAYRRDMVAWSLRAAAGALLCIGGRGCRSTQIRRCGDQWHDGPPIRAYLAAALARRL